MEGDDTKTYQQLDARKFEQFWNEIWQPRERNKITEWISSMTKELEGLEENLKAETRIDLLKTTLKISNWKMPGQEGIHAFGFNSIHDKGQTYLNG